jgi:uncharacterized membrane protein
MGMLQVSTDLLGEEALLARNNVHLRTVSIYVILFGIVLIGAWLRFRNLSVDSIWFDEAASWVQSKGSLSNLISATAHDNYPPLHNLLLFAFINVTGTDSEWVLRAPSALLGVANLMAIYWLGALVGGRITGVLAAAFLAASGFHIYLSQEARMYTLLALAATLYAAAAFYFVRFPSYARAALLAICGLALVYSHPFGTLNWVAIAIAVSVNILLASEFSRRALVLWVIANAAIAIGFLPWAFILFQRARAISGDFWLPYPALDFVYTELSRLIGGGRQVAAALFVGAAIALRSNFRTSVVLLVWAVAPIGLALIESLVSTPIFMNRYLIGALPALFTLAALGVTHLSSRLKWPTTVAAAVIMITIIVGNLRFGYWHRDNWRAAGTFLQGQLQDSDCVLVYPAYNVAALRYYLRTKFCAILPSSLADIAGYKADSARIFAVFYRLPFVGSDLAAAMSAYGRETGRFEFSNFITIVEYRSRAS